MPKIRAFEILIEKRQSEILSAAKKDDWSNIPIIEPISSDKLKTIVQNLQSQASILDGAVDDKGREALQKELNELKARSLLAGCLESVLALVDRMKTRNMLESCKKDLKTKPISDKSKELATNAVSETLKNALNAEFAALGIPHIRTKLNGRNDKGKMKFKLVLDLPIGKNIEEILSEGEQRAIAIGSFLADLSLVHHKNGIVFDDPVSSLDHWRRQDVARRLVEEAKKRQVIIFTHDTVFLSELQELIDNQKLPSLIQNLECRCNKPGYICEGLPWEHQTYKARIDLLEKGQKKLEKQPWPAYPSQDDCDEMRRQYSLFRATIERVIQDVIFNGVVKRYRDWIKVDMLEEVVGFELSEYQKVAHLHKRCCDVVTAHDPSTAKNASVPTAVDLGTDIKQLKDLIDAIVTRRKSLRQLTP